MMSRCYLLSGLSPKKRKIEIGIGRKRPLQVSLSVHAYYYNIITNICQGSKKIYVVCFAYIRCIFFFKYFLVVCYVYSTNNFISRNLKSFPKYREIILDQRVFSVVVNTLGLGDLSREFLHNIHYTLYTYYVYKNRLMNERTIYICE